MDKTPRSTAGMRDLARPTYSLLFSVLGLRIFCFTLLFAASSWAAEKGDTGVEFFEKRIRPVLVKHCYGCHAVDAKKIRGGLLLDSRTGIRTGGDSGAAVTPAEPRESLLLEAMRYESFEMPPDGRLPDSVIADFEAWIRSGAPDPRDDLAKTVESTHDIAAGRGFWAFQPPRETIAPAVRDTGWPASDVDGYLLSQLEARGLKPVSDADRPTLIRRAYFALIGLPPSPRMIDEFVHDTSPLHVAFTRVVDRLLESKHFGERWGRHWLDVVRFAESSGGGRTALFPNAWRYRDYVIAAFNDDVPYDRFLKEQIAGDLMDASDWRQRRRQITATAFLVLGPTNYELQDKEVLEMDIVDEQIDTIGKALLGMTIGCARCHDHKFDPIPTRDYYALAGILKSTKSVIHSNVSVWNKSELPVPPAEDAVIREHAAKLADLQHTLASLRLALKEAGGKVSKSSTGGSQSIKPDSLPGVVIDDVGAEKQQAEPEKERLRAGLAAQIAELDKEVKEHESRRPKRPLAMAVIDEQEVGDIPVAIRGVVRNKGPIIPRGILRAASTGELPRIPEKQSGRMQLADWIASRDNPLTARIMVNRVWHWLFGAGLVRTVDNFGATGDTPSHPQLLDHLAIQFVEDGWSVKKLIRRLMLSRVYRLSTAHDEKASLVDPDNRLLWRMNRQRLDAESIRDALLYLGGNLDLRMGGSNIKPGTKIEYGYRFDSRRRSVYVPVFRNTLPQLFVTFDFADPNIQVGQRASSIIAPQALLLMNHPLVMEQSQAAARQLLARRELTPEQRLRRTYREVLGRPPNDREARLTRRFVGHRDDVGRWGLLYQTLFQSLDFRYLN